MSTFKDKLAKAKLPQRTHEVCLNGDLVAEYEDLERQLERAENTKTDSLAGNGADQIVERMEALEAQMRDSVEVFTLRALPHRRTGADQRPTWDELVHMNPPRRDDEGGILEEDKGAGFNTKTFYDHLVRHCTISPELDDADWDALFAALSEGQFAQLSIAASMLNRGGVDIPFSSAVLRAKRHSSGG